MSIIWDEKELSVLCSQNVVQMEILQVLNDGV